MACSLLSNMVSLRLLQGDIDSDFQLLIIPKQVSVEYGVHLCHHLDCMLLSRVQQTCVWQSIYVANKCCIHQGVIRSSHGHVQSLEMPSLMHFLVISICLCCDVLGLCLTCSTSVLLVSVFRIVSQYQHSTLFSSTRHKVGIWPRQLYTLSMSYTNKGNTKTEIDVKTFILQTLLMYT